MRALLVVATFAFSAAAQTTWTVNSAGGAMFRWVQAAIAAAAPGDRIEVQGVGPYAAFVVDRGVHVEAVDAVCGAIEVLGVPAGQRARVAGFVVDLAANARVRVANCAGPVHLASIGYSGTSNPPAFTGWPGLEVAASANVIVQDSSFFGTRYGSGDGAMISGSSVAFLGCTLLGNSQPPLAGFGMRGWCGLRAATSHVALHGTVAQGGAGSVGIFYPGGGGDGVSVANGTALVLGQCQLHGGLDTGGWNGAAARGNVRLMGDTLLTGSLAGGATLIAPRPTVLAPSGIAIGSMLALDVRGVPGQLVWIGLDLDCQYLPLPALDSALVVTANALVDSPMVLDAQGARTYPVVVPPIAALRHLTLVVQGGGFVGSDLVLGAPAVTHVE
jgi:hypothetical protein